MRPKYSLSSAKYSSFPPPHPPLNQGRRGARWPKSIALGMRYIHTCIDFLWIQSINLKILKENFSQQTHVSKKNVTVYHLRLYYTFSGTNSILLTSDIKTCNDSQKILIFVVTKVSKTFTLSSERSKLVVNEIKSSRPIYCGIEA